MKILKRILYFILGLIALALLVALFVKKEYTIEREIVVNRTKSEVFDYVRYLKNQEDYSVWYSIDPEMKKEYRGEDGSVGFVSAWESENKQAGKGEQEIISITEGQRIDYELRFKEPFESADEIYMITENSGDSSTLVKWGFKGSMKYPMNLMLLFMDMEDMLGADFGKGLSSMKEILENQNN